MFRHKVTGVQNPTCEVCMQCDTMQHRIEACAGSNETWRWVNNIIRNRLNIVVGGPDEIMTINIGSTDSKSKAALWLVVEVMKFNLENYSKHGSTNHIDKFKNVIRESRWNNRRSFTKHFRNFLNVC